MESEKYYTPEIEEFCIGFEYEREDYGEEDVWKKEILDFEYGWLEISQNFHKDKRVKYLDQEDIESLGFKLDPIRSYFNYRNSFSLINEPYKLSLDHIYNENRVILRAHKVDYPTKTLFEGTIKNLSELRKLLKQTKYE
jgi:hypothetical protein